MHFQKELNEKIWKIYIDKIHASINELYFTDYFKVIRQKCLICLLIIL